MREVSYQKTCTNYLTLETKMVDGNVHNANMNTMCHPYRYVYELTTTTTTTLIILFLVLVYSVSRKCSSDHGFFSETWLVDVSHIGGSVYKDAFRTTSL